MHLLPQLYGHLFTFFFITLSFFSYLSQDKELLRDLQLDFFILSFYRETLLGDFDLEIDDLYNDEFRFFFDFLVFFLLLLLLLLLLLEFSLFSFLSTYSLD